MEENPHYFVEKQELFLESLQIFLIFKVLSFDFGEHKFRVLIWKILAQVYDHKLPEWTNSLRRMFSKKFAQNGQNVSKLTLQFHVIHFHLFEKASWNPTERIFWKKSVRKGGKIDK